MYGFNVKVEGWWWHGLGRHPSLFPLHSYIIYIYLYRISMVVMDWMGMDMGMRGRPWTCDEVDWHGHGHWWKPLAMSILLLSNVMSDVLHSYNIMNK